MIGAADADQTTVNPDMRVAAIGIVIAAVAMWGLWHFVYPGGFSDSDVENVKQEIAAEFGKREGVTVSKVVMTKENSRKLSGYVNLESPLLGHVMKMCQAAVGEDGGKGYWACN